jgi:hypothetical protein
MKDLRDIREESLPKLKKEEGPCWPGYKQVGTKMKNGKQVPNCVPISEADMTAISTWKKNIKKIKGLTKDQINMLATLPTPVITSLINQLGMVVSSNDPVQEESIDEAPLVMSDMDMVKSIMQKIEDDISKLSIKKQMEKAWPKVQALAKMAGYKVTKTAQAKGRIFRSDIKK